MSRSASTDLLVLKFHILSLSEILRVASEARVFPLLDLDLNKSKHHEPVVDYFTKNGYAVATKRVDYPYHISWYAC